MRKFTTLSLAGVLGILLTAGDASACHKKRCHHTPAPTCVVVAPCPPPPCPPAPVCEVKKVKSCHKCGGPRHGLFGRCHQKERACAPAPCPPAPCAMPVVYAAPQGYPMPARQAYPAPQGQMLPPPKAMPQG